MIGRGLRGPSLAAALAALFVAFLGATPLGAQVGVREENVYGSTAYGRTELNLLLGQREFTDGDRDPVERHTLVGLDFNWEPEGAFLGIESGLHYSWDRARADIGGSSRELDNYVIELSVGARKSLSIDALRMRPYAGVGGSFLYSRFEGVSGMSRLSDEGGILGAYGKVGVLFEISPSQHIGIEYRTLRAEDVSVGGIDIGSDYDQLAIVFGTSI